MNEVMTRHGRGLLFAVGTALVILGTLNTDRLTLAIGCALALVGAIGADLQEVAAGPIRVRIRRSGSGRSPRRILCRRRHGVSRT